MTLKVRVGISAFIAGGFGFWSAMILFSNVLVGGPYWQYIAFVALSHFLPGIIFGGIASPAWYVAFVGAWGGIFWGLMPLLGLLVGGKLMSNYNSPFIEFFVVPISVGLGGWIGSRIVGIVWKRRAEGSAS